MQKTAEMSHIKQAFDLSERQQFKLLQKLREGHFNWGDSYMKMKDDDCTVLESLSQFLHDLSSHRDDAVFTSHDSVTGKTVSVSEEAIDEAILEKVDETDDISAATYVAGWLIKKISGVHDCEKCAESMLSRIVTNNHMYVFFKEISENQKLNYASDDFTKMVNLTHEYCYHFIDKKGYELNLESRFQEIYLENLKEKFQFCDEHDRVFDFLQVGIPFLIFKYCKDMNKVRGKSAGHNKKMIKVTQGRVKKNRLKAKK
ncbi:hypothetical protein QAD02_003219 [Eretmocerus hayati]|uniref:Uncharacterized protein n=1 Tax=Eretmocerus hayati TaxID=131215 RepID=A0ACC2NL99_9HYME|nr:hypothetical protein QAD02_003219 [Eretmocerus hayati]